MALITVFMKFNKPSGYTKAIIPEEDAEYFIRELGFVKTIPEALKQEEETQNPPPIYDSRLIEEKFEDPETGWGVPGSELWNLRHLDSLKAKTAVIEFIKEITHFTIDLKNKNLSEIKLEAAKLLKAYHE